MRLVWGDEGQIEVIARPGGARRGQCLRAALPPREEPAGPISRPAFLERSPLLLGPVPSSFSGSRSNYLLLGSYFSDP